MKDSKKPLRGRYLLAAAMNQILKHLETWDQGMLYDPLESKYCLLGHVQALAGSVECFQGFGIDSVKDAQRLVGLSYEEALYLYDVERTLSEIYIAVELFVNYGGFLDDFLDEPNLPYIKVPSRIT